MASFVRPTAQDKLIKWASQLVRELNLRVQRVTLGIVTLEASSGQTQVFDSACRVNSVVHLMPANDTAANEVNTTFVSPANVDDGLFVIDHASNDQSDRVFTYAIFENKGVRSQRAASGANVPDAGGGLGTGGGSTEVDLGRTSIDLTGATDSTANLQAFFDTVLDGSTVSVPANSIITISGTITIRNKSLKINWGRTRINCTVATEMFFCKSDYVAVQSVSNIANRREITVQDGTAYSPNDMVKVLSDELDPNGIPSTQTLRQGEWASIESISGNVLTITADLENTYVTNVRIAKLGDDTIEWTGGIYDYPGVESSQSNEEVLLFTGFRSPEVSNVEILKGFGPGVEFLGCVGPICKDSLIENLEDLAVDTESSGTVGYGVASGSCIGAVIKNNTFGKCRHAYTTRVRSTTENDDEIEKYGHEESPLIEGNTCLAPSGSGFDSHHATRRARFVDNTSKDGRGAGFAARGTDIEFDGNKSVNCQRDITTFTQTSAPAGSTNTVRVINHTSINSGRAELRSPTQFINYRRLGNAPDADNTGNSTIEVFDLDDQAVVEFFGITDVELPAPKAANQEYIRAIDGSLFNYGTMIFRTSDDANAASASLIDREAGTSYVFGTTRITGAGLARIIRDRGDTYSAANMFGRFVIDNGSSIALSSDDGDASLIGGATLQQLSAALASGVF